MPISMPFSPSHRLFLLPFILQASGIDLPILAIGVCRDYAEQRMQMKCPYVDENDLEDLMGCSLRAPGSIKASTMVWRDQSEVFHQKYKGIGPKNRTEPYTVGILGGKNRAEAIRCKSQVIGNESHGSRMDVEACRGQHSKRRQPNPLNIFLATGGS